MKRLFVVTACVLLVAFSETAAAEAWKAGLARENITPQESMWMAGYGARTAPSSGTLGQLWAKALVLQDDAGHRTVLVTLDLIGIDRGLSQSVCRQLKEKYGFERAAIALCTSHTHSGPVVGLNLRTLHHDIIDVKYRKLAMDYAASLERQIVALVGRAVDDLAPAEIRYGQGSVDVAANRRNNKEADAAALRAAGSFVGPTDHDLPLLVVKSPAGKLRGLIFGYACHATTLDGQEYSGDWPGYAQAEIERQHPGATAMFWAGCGADQNPLPRRKVEYAEQYGRQVSAAIDAVLGTPMNPIAGTLSSSYREIDLPLGKLPTEEQLQADTQSKDKYIAARAQLLIARLVKGEKIPQSYPYPVQVWRIGPELKFITLGGEVVVDYALRLKQELGAKTTWVAGYSNDVMAYIPSRRVLIEGGYEGGGAMVYYSLPTAWAPECEELIIRAVHEQLKP